MIVNTGGGIHTYLAMVRRYAISVFTFLIALFIGMSLVVGMWVSLWGGGVGVYISERGLHLGASLPAYLAI